MGKYPAVFLDRDNTLIANDGDLGDPAGVVMLKGAASAVASLRGLGYRIVVVTNQGGVARGKYSEADVEAVHERIARILREVTNTYVDRFYFCPFHPQGTVPQYRREHPWRKPQPGMLLAAAQDLDLDLSASWMVGDQMRDVEAGRAAGVRTILLGDAPAQGTQPDFTARDLIEAARIVLQRKKPELAGEVLVEPEAIKRWQAPEVTTPRPPGPVVATSATRPRTTTAPADKPFVPATKPLPAAPVETPASPHGPEPQPAPEPEPAAPRAPAAPPPAPAAETPDSPVKLTDHLLRQILQQLRDASAGRAQWSVVDSVAVVLQGLAITALLGGLMLSDTQEGFQRWAGVAVVVQLGVIAALLFRSR